MAHDKDNSSPLAGILMTAFFGIISLVLGAVTMYQVHSIWVKYHHQRKENRDLGALPLSLSPNQCTANLTDILQTSNTKTHPHPSPYPLQIQKNGNALPPPSHPYLPSIKHIPSPLVVRKSTSAPTRAKYRKKNRTRKSTRVQLP